MGGSRDFFRCIVISGFATRKKRHRHTCDLQPLLCIGVCHTVLRQKGRKTDVPAICGCFGATVQRHGAYILLCEGAGDCFPGRLLFTGGRRLHPALTKRQPVPVAAYDDRPVPERRGGASAATAAGERPVFCRKAR